MGYPRAVGRSPEVRDPLHGTIPVSLHELQIIDHPLFQRLRYVKQLGFSELAFPGATHNRYLHSIGAMHLAGLAFDALFEDGPGAGIPPARRDELRRMLRIAALLHDVGHAPFSHASEFAMPRLDALGVAAYAGQPELYRGERQAPHEDYTIKAITDSALTDAVQDGGPPAAAVAGLIDPVLAADPAWYEAGGIDWRPLLQQLVSSELDVDRMDYLARDAHYTGVHYGVFDIGWIFGHLAVHVLDDRAYLALSDRAIYAFDDFLIARYHMFVMVYFHYKSVAYEEMLKQYLIASDDAWRIPTDLERFVDVDDHHLIQHLRASDDPWAQRIVDRREYKLLLERHGPPSELDLSPVLGRLEKAGVQAISTESLGVLSKYFSGRREPQSQGHLPLGASVERQNGPPPIWVLHEPYRGAPNRRATELEESTRLFDRYAEQLGMARIYVPPEQVDAAGAAIADIA